jgi:nucleotide-binding universal stress UspA family protein
MSEETPNTPRRVLVAVDASPWGLSALEAAIQLAAALRASLQGVFVEDANLFRLAQLPAVRQIELPHAGAQPLETMRLERTLRAQAETVRRLLAETARRVRVEWSFSVLRGHMVRTTLALAGQADLLVLGCRNPAPRCAGGLDRPSRTGPSRSLLVIYDGSLSSRRAFETAADLAPTPTDQIVFCLVASREGTIADVAARANDDLRRAATAAAVRLVPWEGVARLLRLAQQQATQLLLIGFQNPLLDEDTIATLVHELDCPVALVA